MVQEVDFIATSDILVQRAVWLYSISVCFDAGYYILVRDPLRKS